MQRLSSPVTSSVARVMSIGDNEDRNNDNMLLEVEDVERINAWNQQGERNDNMENESHLDDDFNHGTFSSPKKQLPSDFLDIDEIEGNEDNLAKQGSIGAAAVGVSQLQIEVDLDFEPSDTDPGHNMQIEREPQNVIVHQGSIRGNQNQSSNRISRNLLFEFGLSSRGSAQQAQGFGMELGVDDSESESNSSNKRHRRSLPLNYQSQRMSLPSLFMANNLPDNTSKNLLHRHCGCSSAECKKAPMPVVFKGLMTELASCDGSSLVMHNIASFLPVKEIVRLSELSHDICAALRGCALRLDQLNGAVATSTLPLYFHSIHDLPETLTHWKISGVELRSDFPAKKFWSFLQVSQLAALKITGRWSNLNLIFLMQASETLLELDISGSCKSTLNFEAIKACTKLRKLDLNMKNVTGLRKTADFVPQTKHLQRLALIKAPILNDISSLTWCRNLTSLDLNSCEQLFDLTPIKACKLLESLSIRSCTKIKDIGVVAELQSLQKFDSSECISIHSFLPLMNCEELISLNLENCRDVALSWMFNFDLRKDRFARNIQSRRVLKLIRSEAKETLKEYSLHNVLSGMRLLMAFLQEFLDTTSMDTFKFPLYQDEDVDLVCDILDLLASPSFADLELSPPERDIISSSLARLSFSLLSSIKAAMTEENYQPLLDDLNLKWIHPSVLKLYAALSLLLSHMSNSTTCVINLVDFENDLAPALFEMLSLRLDFYNAIPNSSYYSKTTTKDLDVISLLDDIEENAASALLLVALVPDCRMHLMTCEGGQEGIKSLVETLWHGTDNAAIEAAGALWNLAASLEIGKILVESERYDVIPALLFTIQSRPLKAKTQAIGALRNLAILETNKAALLTQDVVKYVVQALDKLLKWGDSQTFMALDRDVEVESIVFGANSKRNNQVLDWNTRLNNLLDEERVLVSKSIATLRILASYNCSDNWAQKLCVESGAMEVFLKCLAVNRIATFSEQAATAANFALEQSEVVVDCSGGLLALSFLEDNRPRMASKAAIKDLIHLIERSQVDTVVISCCGCIWNLAMNDQLEVKIVECGAIPALISRIDHPNEQVVAKAVGALKNLCYQTEHKEQVFEYEGELRLLNRIQKMKESDSLLNLVSTPAVKTLNYLLGALKLLSLGSYDAKLWLARRNTVSVVTDFLRLSDFSSEQLGTGSRDAKDTLRYAVGILVNISEVLAIADDASHTEQERALCDTFVLNVKQFRVYDKMKLLLTSTQQIAAKSVKADASQFITRLNQVQKSTTPLSPSSPAARPSISIIGRGIGLRQHSQPRQR